VRKASLLELMGMKNWVQRAGTEKKSDFSTEAEII
jgi:hypothetical protein